MVDWNGLFKWSMAYQDGTQQSQFKPMSEEDRKWLEAAMKQYTFNDTDRLKEVCGELAAPALEKGKLLDLLDELLELVELHVHNSLNLCVCGGMQTLLDIAFQSPVEEARRAALGVFAFANQNNTEVQQLTFNMGALNLMHQYVKESDARNREAVVSGLSAFLRGINTDGKRAFLAGYDGLGFLRQALLEAQAHGLLRLSKKLVMLLYDLIVNDELILHQGNPRYLRLTVGSDPEFLVCFGRFLKEGSLSDYQWHDLRESVLLILEELAKVRRLEPDLRPALDQLRAAAEAKIKENPASDFNEMLQKEIQLVDRVVAAQAYEAPQQKPQLLAIA